MNGNWTATSGIQYLYGTSLPMQTQPVMDTANGGPVLSWSDVSFDTNKYIAEVDPRLGSMKLDSKQGGEGYTFQKDIGVYLQAKQDVAYTLSGDFV